MAEKKIIGIDFTNREIRMAQVSVGRGMPKLERFALGVIPEGVFSGGRLAEPTRLAEEIKSLLRGYRFTSKKAVLGISGRYGVTRLLTLPRMTASQTRDTINLQLNQYVPFPPPDTIYDFKVLREIKEEEQLSQEILLVATRRSGLTPLLGVIKKAGLQLVGVKLTTLASFCLFEDLYKDSEQAIAFVDVRDTVTDISFVAEDFFRLSRSVEFGLTNMVDRLRQKMGISYEEAVEHIYRNKIDLMESYRPVSMQTQESGIVDVSPMEGSVGDGADLDRQLGLAKSVDSIEKQVRDNVLRVLSQFVNELMRSIRYFESQSKRRSRVGRIVVFGYVGALTGLQEYLAEQTALEVTVVTEVPGVEVALDETEKRELKGKEAVLVVPVGLAFEAIKRKRIELNLIPREAVFRRKSFNAMKFAAVIVLLLLAALANVYIQLNANLKELKEEEAELQRQIAIIEPYYKKSQEFKGYNAIVQEKLRGVVTLAAAQPPWPVIMDELGRVMRDAAYIDEMHWDANKASWEIHGYCLGTDEVQKLLVNLWHSDILNITEAEDLSSDMQTSSEGLLGPDFGGRGGSGGFGFSAQPRGGFGERAEVPDEDSTAKSGLKGLVPGDQPHNNKIRKPKPMYKVPEGGLSWREIEWYYQGQQFILPIMWEFTLGGTINSEVMLSGKNLFGELSDFISIGGGTGATPGGRGPMPSPGTPPPSTGPGPGESDDGTGE